MSREWQICLAGALIIHGALLFGFQLKHSQPAILPSRDELEVMLIAAPAPVPVVAHPVVPPTPRVMPPPEPVVPEAKPVETVPVPVPIEKVVAPAPTPPKPVVAPPLASPPVTPIGDGSSPKPADAPITQPAKPDIRATPDYLKNPEPVYPLAARRRHQEGLVLVSVIVTPEGKAARVELKTSSGFPVLDEAALQAVRGWEFKPAQLGAKAIESEIEVPVRFKLTD